MSKKRKKQLEKVEVKPGKKAKLERSATGPNSMVNWLVVLVLILPLLFSRASIDPTIAVRYILLGFFLLLFIANFSINKSLGSVPASPWVKAAFICGIGFAAWSLFTLSGAVNPAAGYYETARSFLNIILLFIVFVMAVKEESRLLKLFKTLVLVSIIQSIVGIFQFYELAFTNIPGNFQPYGLMANRNLFASAQVLMIPFALYVLYKSEDRWRWFSIIALGGIFISILISQTRSAWVSATLMLLVNLLMIIFFSKTERKKWLVGYGIGAVVVAVLVLLIINTSSSETSGSFRARVESITNPNLESSEHSTETIKDRLKIWDKTIAVFKDHPLMGVGTSNWKLTVLGYGSEGLVWEEGYYVPDRPHNVYLQLLGETGIPGVLLYLGMWVLIALMAIKVILKPQNNDRKILAILLLGGLVAFASDNMFSFGNERIEHTLYLTLTGGIILGLYVNNSEPGSASQYTFNTGWLIGALVIIAFNIFIGFQKYKFETHMNMARSYEQMGDPRNVIEEADAGLSSWVTVDPVGKPMELYTAVAYKNMNNPTKALQEIEKAKKYNPNSAMIWNNAGTIHTDLGQFDKAIENYLRALKLTPKFEMVLKNLAVNYFQTGNYAACISTLEKVNIKGEPYLENLMNEARNRVRGR